ncbi:MAG: hypothetical protein ACFFB2_10820 [Promethearchaeota archaeon]
MKEKIRIFIITSFLFIILISVEGFIILDDPSGILKEFLASPIELINYLPIIILLFVFVREITSLFNKNVPMLDFTWLRKGIIFVSNFNIYLVIFETHSLGKIQTSELSQLKHLELFSLELDKKNRCVRVILYSNSYKELDKLIINSKPILEVVLPDIHLISFIHYKKLFDKTEVVKFRKQFILKENSKFLFPQFISNPTASISSSFSRIVLAFNIHKRGNSSENDNVVRCVQLYCLEDFNQNSFFRWANKILSSPHKNSPKFLWGNHELQRIRLRCQIEKRFLFCFQDGLNLFNRELALLLLGLKKVGIEEKKTDYSLDTKQYETKHSSLLSTETEIHTSGANQICSEMCNILKENKLSNTEKEKKCVKRGALSKKLLINDDFYLIIENILKQKKETDQFHLISELYKQISHKQFFCVLAHLSQIRKPEISHQKIIKIIIILLRLIYQVQVTPSSDKRSPSVVLADNEVIEKISPSLTPN